MNFEEYLISKKIDSGAFHAAEASVWSSWKSEFEHLHPNSFTTQKLYLINPIRRKYPLKEQKASVIPAPPAAASAKVETGLPPVVNPQPETDQTDVSKAAPGSPPPSSPAPQVQTPKPAGAKPAVPRPVIKPKPKIN